ncbi:MAG: glycoside hydrolase [Bacillota bacterium]
MKNIYVIFAFHAHELLWDLPRKLLSTLEDDNPMKDSTLDENYIKKRKEENRDIYSLGIRFGDNLDAPLCMEFSNELLSQVREVLPGTFQSLSEAYGRGRLYPLYGHAHHTHVSLLSTEEITQEIQWNMQYLHNYMYVPYPKYNGLFATEASYSYDKMSGIAKGNIDYVIFPHLSEEKVPFYIKGEGDYRYKPFLIKTENKNILAFPRNFNISQEIWRPITKMKREEVKFQGYMLGKYPVFRNEYMDNMVEEYPIEMEEGVNIYKEVLLQELKKTPDNGVLVYIQDLELMDFGDIALEIMEKAWKKVLVEQREEYVFHFVTPDQYIDRVLKLEGMAGLPELEFDRTTWAPEIRLVLRADGHYPPLGVDNDRYSRGKTGLYDHPHVFWENGKYFCGIFDTLVDNFNISLHVSGHGERFTGTNYNLAQENLNIQAIMYLRIMKRACNWGWRPTEGRQKLPCLKGFLLCAALLKKLEEYPWDLIFNRNPARINEKNLVGIVETLDVLIDQRVNYLKYGLEQGASYIEVDQTAFFNEIEYVFRWKNIAVKKAGEIYAINREEGDERQCVKQCLELMRDYCQAVFMATEHIQRIWIKIPDTEFMVEKMYEYLYNIYPPAFPSLIGRIDNMEAGEIEDYFTKRGLTPLKIIPVQQASFL